MQMQGLQSKTNMENRFIHDIDKLAWVKDTTMSAALIALLYEQALFTDPETSGSKDFIVCRDNVVNVLGEEEGMGRENSEIHKEADALPKEIEAQKIHYIRITYSENES